MKRGRIRIKKKRKEWIKQSLLFGLILVLFLITVIGFNILEKPEKKTEWTGELGSFGISRLGSYDLSGLKIIKHNCSDENLKAVWDSIFKENSIGINIVSDKDVSENCNNSLMYKILPNNLTYFIYLRYFEGKSSMSGKSYNYFGNFTADFVDLINNTNTSNLGEFYNFINDELNIAYAKSKMQGNRSIVDYASADPEYNSIFKIPNQTLNFIPENANINGYELSGPLFYYINFSSVNNIDRFGSINPNQTLDYLYYQELMIKNVSLVKTNNISDINLKGSRRHYGVIKLEDYFTNLQLTDGNLTFNYLLSSPGAFQILKNNHFDINHTLDFDTNNSLGGSYLVNITLTYFDSSAMSNNFNVNINGCLDSDNGYNILTKGTSQNLTNSSIDVCLNTSNTTLIEYYCGLNGEIIKNSTQCPLNYVCYEGACIENGSINHAPVFLANSCDGLLAIKNTNFKMDMKGCFRDEDNESLNYRYEIIQNGSWIITRNLTVLTIIPNQNWIGKGRFNLYAKDNFKETKGIVNFEIISGGITVPPTEPPIIEEPERFEILNPYPSSESLAISQEQSQDFSIENTEYDSIEWYLDGLFKKSNSNIFTISNLNPGNHIVKVEIKNGEDVASRTWNLVVRTVEEQKQYIIGKIVFWLLIAIFSVAIIIIVLLIMRERERERERKKRR
ncbi:MAG: hypothetical protein PHF67_02330 [Candidatus Nanoarchaeia archaeon]|nr:hypothetical protein [Candidatus Nanoarchaeia archaeon]